MKLLERIQTVEASELVFKLLSGTQLGIVQHPGTEDVVAESELIKLTRTNRPAILDSVESLDIQTNLLSALLTSYQKSSFGVEGQLFARVLKNSTSSATFDRVWFEEYMSGCDRDQIAFYGAAARMRMERIEKFSCQRFDRSGKYLSQFDGRFTFAIHCQLELIL